MNDILIYGLLYLLCGLLMLFTTALFTEKDLWHFPLKIKSKEDALKRVFTVVGWPILIIYWIGYLIYFCFASFYKLPDTRENK